jgi:lipid A 3-O-deacylase
MVFAVLAIIAVPAFAQTHIDPNAGDPDFLSIGVGMFDINAASGDRGFMSGALQFEYASDYRMWIFHPIAGAMINSDGGGDIYAGVGIDLFFGNRWVVTPAFAPSAYIHGSSKNLGEVLEFRSSIDIAYRFDDRSRLGLELYHLSNAGLSDHNPGTEVLLVKYSVPFAKITN